jgi:uncharacterized protein YjbI with pentapeptide repeats
VLHGGLGQRDPALGDDPGVTLRRNQSDPPTPRPLSNWTIAAGALVVLAVAAVVSFLLLRRYGGQGAQVQLDAIRTAGTLVIGTGGAVALLLTARRQRYTELAMVHTDRDAAERRSTELYFKAVELFNSDLAQAQRAGLYALERLANSAVEQRQTTVNIICDYLRRAYTPPPWVLGRSYHGPEPARRRRAGMLSDGPLHATPTSLRSRQEEEQLRVAAQGILSRNLRVAVRHRERLWHRTPRSTIPTWSEAKIQLNLSDALLLEFSLSNCQTHYTDFTRAQFTGAADFRGAQFTGVADFTRAQFTGAADFRGAQFTGVADFRGAQFTGAADFEGAQFTGMADFEGAQFTSEAHFYDAQFTSVADFKRAQFTSGAYFEVAQFTSWARFESAQFTGRTNFEFAKFARAPSFTDAQFTDLAEFTYTEFTGGAHFEGAQFTSGAHFAPQFRVSQPPRETSTQMAIFDQFLLFPATIVLEGARIPLSATLSCVWPSDWTTRPANPDNGEDPAFLFLTKAEDNNPPDT